MLEAARIVLGGLIVIGGLVWVISQLWGLVKVPGCLKNALLVIVGVPALFIVAWAVRGFAEWALGAR